MKKEIDKIKIGRLLHDTFKQLKRREIKFDTLYEIGHVIFVIVNHQLKQIEVNIKYFELTTGLEYDSNIHDFYKDYFFKYKDYKYVSMVGGKTKVF